MKRLFTVLILVFVVISLSGCQSANKNAGGSAIKKQLSDGETIITAPATSDIMLSSERKTAIESDLTKASEQFPWTSTTDYIDGAKLDKELGALGLNYKDYLIKDKIVKEGSIEIGVLDIEKLAMALQIVTGDPYWKNTDSGEVSTLKWSAPWVPQEGYCYQPGPGGNGSCGACGMGTQCAFPCTCYGLKLIIS